MELHTRDKDLGQTGQMLPLTPRGDSSDYQAMPEILHQHNVCLLKKKMFLKVHPNVISGQQSHTNQTREHLSDGPCGLLLT